MLVFFLACQSPPPPPFDPVDPQPGWSAGADLPFPRQEHGVVALDGRLVVVAGVDDGPRVGAWVHAYDPVAGRWAALPDLPMRMHHPNVAVVEGALFVLGGLDGDFRQVDGAWVLPAGASSWATVASLPADRAVGAAGVAVIEGAVHLVGGLHDFVARPWHQVYRPDTDRWEQLPDAPASRDHLAVGAIDAALYVAGGRDGSLSAFVPQTLRWADGEGWTEVQPIPTPRGGVAAAVLGGRLHVLGGEGNPDDASGVFAAHEAYDPVSDRWSAIEPMWAPRHGMGAAVIDDVLWVPGGAPVDNFGAVATNHAWVE